MSLVGFGLLGVVAMICGYPLGWIVGIIVGSLRSQGDFDRRV